MAKGAIGNWARPLMNVFVEYRGGDCLVERHRPCIRPDRGVPFDPPFWGTLTAIQTKLSHFRLVFERWRYSPSMKKKWRIAAVVIALAMLDAGRLAWVCDDAFISYRYAAHLVDGLGLVYNAGEQVEGYTNFLWTIFLALGAALGVPLPEWSIGLGLGCYLMALIGLAWKPGQTALDWVALLAGVSIVHFRIFATSGLETMMMVACVVWTLRCFEANAMRAVFGGCWPASLWT